MNLLRQMFIVCVIFFIGQSIQVLSGIPIPGSVIGMILLFVLMYCNVISVESLKDLADFCLGNLAFFFVPVVVGVVAAKEKILDVVPQLIFIIVLSTSLVMLATGITAQYLLRRKEEKSSGSL